MSDEILSAITQAVEDAVDTKINGKLMGIKNHLDTQDKTLQRVEELLQDRDFLVKLWAFIKFLGGIIVTVGTSILLYKKLLK